MRRALVALLAVTLAVAVALAAVPSRSGHANERRVAHLSDQGPAAAVSLQQQDPADTGEGTTTTVRGVPGGDIIPEPGTGQAPQDAGDRGGGLQIALFVIIVVAIGALVMLARREVRRSREREAENASR